MEHNELSLVGKLDVSLVKGFYLLLGGLKRLSLWLVGLLMLLGSVWMVFEYDEGLADISWHEWGFLLLLPLLLWRHLHYCRHFAFGFWCGLSRLLTFQGVLAIVLFSATGLMLGLLLESEHLDGFLLYLSQEDPLSKLVGCGLTLVAVFLAAPTAAHVSATQQTKSARVEPTVSPAAKEASL